MWVSMTEPYHVRLPEDGNNQTERREYADLSEYQRGAYDLARDDGYMHGVALRKALEL